MEIKTLWLPTTMVYLCILLPQMAMIESQQMVALDMLSSSVYDVLSNSFI
jgi:hypothetical protein